MTDDRRALSKGPRPATGGPLTPDAAVREIVQLLSLVAEEEQALARLERCVADLHRIAAARAALARCTDIELAEAHTWSDGSTANATSPMLPVSAGVGPS